LIGLTDLYACTMEVVSKKIFDGKEMNAEMFQQINNLFPSIIYIYSIGNSKVSYLNGGITDLLGYEEGDINSWDDHLSKLVFKEDEELVKQELEKYNQLRNDETYSYNSRLIHKAGQWSYFRTTGSILSRNSTGQPSSLLFIAVDISRHSVSREEIAAKEELLREAEEIIQFGIWSWNPKEEKTIWSDGMYTLLGYLPGETGLEASKANYLKHVSPNDIDTFSAKIQWGIDHKKGFEHIHTIITNAGQHKVVSSKSRVFVSNGGELMRIFVTVRDITEQFNTENGLSSYKQMTVDKEKFLNSGSWETDLSTGLSVWSEGMYLLFGYDPGEDKNKLQINNDFYYSHLSQEERGISSKNWDNALKHQDSYSYQVVITSRDGKEKLLETFGKILRESDGIPYRVIGATRDITRLKSHERELEMKILELERSNVDLEEFAYVASHDLQEPLRKITVFGERLKLQIDKNPGEGLWDNLKRMLKAAENMRILIDSLLEFSKVSLKVMLHKETDLNHLLEEVRNELELDAPDSSISISSGQLPVLEVIPIQIKQLFTNIILNAMKFCNTTERCAIRIESRLMDEKELDAFKLRPTIPYYEFSIKDNGIGFEPEFEEKIFQLFTRLHGKSVYPGAGIGLAICMKIIENHGGLIYAKSNPGKGATFYFILPTKKQ